MRIRGLIFVLVACCSVVTGGCSRDGEVRADASDRVENDAPAFRAANELVSRMPDDPTGYTQLAILYMKKARETGDFNFNRHAEAAVTRALEIAPTDIGARKLEASLHLANHRFSEGIDAATKLLDHAPSDPFLYGVLTDAYVETGDYRKAVAAAQKMVDLKPGTASYSRVAQLRSLHGDHKGAVEMFTEAARAADPSDKETQSWCLVQLGDEYWKYGKYGAADKVYDEALANYPDYYLALVSKGRIRASVGDYASAETLLNLAQSKVPNAHATLLLADIYTLRGEVERAARQYENFDQMQEELGDAADHKRLVTSLADRGRIDVALSMAQSEYAAEKSIHSADLLAWCLFKAGRSGEARGYIREAMRLGTDDARTLFHAGMIAKATGDRAGARRLLRKALTINPSFDLIQSVVARQSLAELG